MNNQVPMCGCGKEIFNCECPPIAKEDPEDLRLPEGRMKHKGEIALRAMLNGIGVTLDGREYFLDEGLNVVSEVEKYVFGNTASTKPQLVMVVVDITLGGFLKMCHNLSDNDILNLVYKLGVMDLRRKKR